MANFKYYENEALFILNEYDLYCEFQYNALFLNETSTSYAYNALKSNLMLWLPVRMSLSFFSSMEDLAKNVLILIVLLLV